MVATIDELRNVSVLKSKIDSGNWNQSDVRKFLGLLKQAGIEDGSLYESIQNESGTQLTVLGSGKAISTNCFKRWLRVVISYSR